MHDPPRDEGAEQVEVEAREVPAIEVARTTEVPAIEVGRTTAEPSEGARTLLAKEEDEDEVGDGTVSGKLVTSAKLAQGLVEVNLLPRYLCSRLVLVDVVL